jgi:cysteinyl-tRNA synthetase
MDIEAYRQRFTDSMDDDFNTAQALAALFDMARDINRASEQGCKVSEAQTALSDLATDILGLTLEEKESQLDAAPFIELAKEHGADTADKAQPASHYIELLIQKRNEARKAKKWALADSIRNELLELGIALEDKPQGTVWRHKRED